MSPLPFVGVTVNESPLQIAAGILACIEGLGFTVTVIVKITPSQLPDLGVTV